VGKRVFLILFLATITAFSPGTAFALSAQQEDLIALPDRFAVVVSNFDPDGQVTREGMQKIVEDRLTASRLTLVNKKSPPPLAFINVNISRQDGPEGKAYLVDMNVYNHSTVNTTYRLRKGTIWMVGSFKVATGTDFSANLEMKVKQMVDSFVRDYRIANPAGSRQE